MRFAIFTAFLAVLAASCSAPAAESKSALEPVVLAPSPVLSVASPKDMRQVMLDAYRLHPDRRFSVALKRLGEFVTARPPEIVRSGGQWRVADEITTYGVLSEIPTFEELFGAIVAYAKTLPPAKVPPASSVIDPPGFSSAEAFAALRAIDTKAAAGTLAGGDLHAAAVWSTRLALQAADGALNDDGIAGHALAMQAIAVAGGAHTANDRSLCLLQWVLRYTAAANACAAEMHSGDPVRLLIAEDGKGLSAMARDHQGTPESQFTYALYLARRGERKELRAFVADMARTGGLGLELVKPILESNDFAIDSFLYLPLTAGIEALLARELGDAPHVRDVLALSTARLRAKAGSKTLTAARWLDDKVRRTTTERLTSVGERLERMRKIKSGPFLPGELKASYYEGFVAAGLYHAMRHAVDDLASHPAAATLATEIGTPEHPPFAALSRWFEHRIGAATGAKPVRELVHDVQRSPLGTAPLEKTMDDLYALLERNDTRVTALNKVWFSRLDTRPGRLIEAAEVAYYRLLDMPLAERLFAASVDQNPWGNLDTMVWLAEFRNDGHRLVQMMSDTRFQSRLSYIAERLESLEGIAVSDAEYEVAASAGGYRWWPMSSYVNVLVSRGKTGQARALIQRCLDAHPEGWDHLFCMRAMAGTYLQEKRYDDALVYSAPITESYQWGAVSTGAWVLAGLGRDTEAETLFRRNVKRYPDLFASVTDYMRFLWSRDRAADAATAFDAYVKVYGFTGDAPRTLATEARRAAATLSHVQLMTAAGALRHQESALASLANGFHGGRNSEAAYQTVLLMKAQNYQHKMQINVTAYSYMRAARGLEAADAWILAQISPNAVDESAMFLWHFPNLLWKLPAKDTDFTVWTMRATYAALLSPDDPNRAVLSNYFALPRDHRYHTLGRAVLGFETDEVLYKLADTHRHRCEVAYAIAMRSLAAGDWEAASDWFRVAVETGSLRDGEFHWSRDRLLEWRNAGKSLAALKAARQAEGRPF